jgi:predicted transcriptional regulator
MASKKITISLPEDVVERVTSLADRSGLPVSTWIAHAAADRARIEDGLAALQEWERESGALRPEDLAEARARLAEADAAMVRERR